MKQSYRCRAARLILIPLVLALVVGSTHQKGLLAAQADAVTIAPDGSRLWLTTPYLWLEFDLRHPSMDMVRVAPLGDGQYGESVGVLLEEATGQGRRLRSTTDDADGARASWMSKDDTLYLRLEGIDSGNLASSNWDVGVPLDSPTLRIDRAASLRGEVPVESLGLALRSPAVPEGSDPASLAYMLNGGTYRLEVGPGTLEQGGGLLGRLAVDNPELTYSARTDQPDRVVARQEEAAVSLELVRGISPPRPGGQFHEGIVFRFGWTNDFLDARSDVAPELENRLLASGYYGNAVITPALGPVLSASMRDYRGSVWSRDMDYAMQGYSYVLDDMSVFRNSLQKFLERVEPGGVAPEYILLDGRFGNRESWDSMANVVQATYTYVSKTGDVDFYKRNETPVKRAIGWIRALDTNGDGLPDRDIFPYGYTDTVENGPMHTYAVAKFYAAVLAVAELDEAIGKRGQPWRSYARRMQDSFKQPVAAGGYWNPESGFPIAWKRADGKVFGTFETFGVFEAIRVGLLTEASQLQSIAAWLDHNHSAFLNSNTYPERLMIGGYELSVKKAEVPLDKIWIMDCNAPWITGLSVPARVQLGRLEQARQMLDVYASSSNRSTPHAEFGAGPLGRYGPGETLDGGRLWDNWSWFSAVYGTHFGLRMTPRALEIEPRPLDAVGGRQLSGVTYQGAHVDLGLEDDGYWVVLEAPRQLVLRPPYGYRAIDVNGDGDIQGVRTITPAAGAANVIRAYK